MFGQGLQCKRQYRKALTMIVVLMLISVASFVLINKNDSVAVESSQVTNAELRHAIDEQFALLSEQFDDMVMADFGLSYMEYNEIMSSLAGKAISITTVDGEIVAEIIESIDKGKTMTDSEFRGDQFRVYIDTVTMSTLAGLGTSALSTALGAIIGSAIAPGAGTVVGAIIGILSGGVLAGLQQLIIEQLALDNGIWIDITIRGHFTLFGKTIYFMLPPSMWSFSGMGAQ